MRAAAVLSFIAASVAIASSDLDALAQGAPSNCGELERIAILAHAAEKFAAIAGAPREGDFSETTMPLTGWPDCSIYGQRTYSCDSSPYPSAGAAEQAIEEAAQAIAACPNEAWRRRPQQSSPSYQVLTYSRAPASMTLSSAQTEDGRFLMRLIIFTRRD